MKNKILSGVLLLTLNVLFALNGIGYAGKAIGKIDNTVDLSSSGAPPSVTIFPPTEGSTVGGMYVEVSCSGYAENCLKDLWLHADGILLGEWHPYYCEKGFDRTVKWDTTVLEDGLHTIRVVAVDRMGFSAEDSVTVNVFNPPPTVVIISPAAGSTVGGRSVTWQCGTYATAPNDTPINLIRFYLDGTLFTGWGPIGYPHPRGQSYKTTWDTTTLTDGLHTLKVEVEDMRGRIGFTEITVNVFNPPPTVVIISPAAGSTISGSNVIWECGTYATAPNDTPINLIRFYLDGTLFTGWGPIGYPHPRGQSYKITWNTTTLIDGLHTLKVEVEDMRGRVGYAEITVTTFNPPPSVAITSPQDESIVSGIVRYSWDASIVPPNDAGISYIRLYIDGALFGSYGPHPYYMAHWASGVDWDTRSYSPGTHVLKVEAEDRAGKIGEKSIIVYVAGSILSKYSGDNQQAPIKATLTNPLVVKIATTTGIPISGMTITFAITSQPEGATGASLSVTSTKTDVNGLASTSLTLGDKPGTYTITATGKGTTPTSVTFTEEAVFGVDKVIVTPTEIMLRLDQTQSFSAKAISFGPDRVEGTEDDEDITSSVADQIVWSVSEVEINSVLVPIGSVLPLEGPTTTFTPAIIAEGTITATVADKSGEAKIAVVPDYILITPKEGIICVGAMQQFTANGWTNGINGIKEDGGGDDINWGAVTVTWTTSVSSNVGIIDDNGLFTAGNTPGTGTVTATHITVGSDTANLYVFGGDIIGPSSLLVFKHRNAPSIELSATAGQPAGVEFLWKVTEGEDKVQIDEETITLSTFKLKGIKGSISQGDIKVILTYTLGSTSCQFSKSLTALRPAKLTHPPLEFFKHEVKFGRVVVAVGIGCKAFNWTLFDQFGSPLANVPCSEKVKFDMKACIPKRFIPIPRVGKESTDANGQVSDVYRVFIFGGVPTNTNIVFNQRIICGGFEGDNRVTITVSDITDTSPVMVK